MFRKLLFFALFWSISLYTQAQILPAEGSKLHYRMVGFLFPAKPTGSNYKIELAQGNYNTVADFKQNIKQTYTGATNKITALVPAFGKEYTWRAVNEDNTPIPGQQGKLYHFSTENPELNITHVRLNVTKKTKQKQDNYIFSDGARTLYDMDGQAIWMLPNIPDVVNKNTVVRDMKLTSRATITLLANDVPYEISYDAKVLWKAPHNNIVTNDTAERYHHEFTRLANGHYMVLGTENVMWEWRHNTATDSSLYIAPDGTKHGAPKGKTYEPITFGTVIEYDASGKVVWYWKSSDYFRMNGFKNPGTIKGFFDPHENSFYFDESSKMVYVSFKNINQIYKVSYNDKSIVSVLGIDNSYGATNMPDKIYSPNTVFCEQHSCKVTQDGQLYVFNNNICHPMNAPSVIVLQETGKNAFKTIWEYYYPLNLSGPPRMPLTKGGNVTELPDRSFLVSFCHPYGNLFIVNRKKELLWDAMLEKSEDGGNTWLALDQYRASIILGSQQMEKLVWFGK